MKSRKPHSTVGLLCAHASAQNLPGIEISRAALEWFRLRGRDLPWRNTADPYAILVSELMLQQTTVAAVVRYYDPFLARFPHAEALARADEQEVLTQWAGLGYYRRARLLQAAARAVLEQFGGVFPREPALLQSLPGVGRYTAGAIASFAYDLPAPVVEANTARLMARLFAIEGPLTSGAVQRLLWRCAELLLPESGGRDHNSALMDLGAVICTPTRPRCHECPLSTWCESRRRGLVDQIPAPAAKRDKIQLAFAGVVLERNGAFLVRRIPAGQWHAGMFEFPKVPVEAGTSPDSAAECVRKFLLPVCEAGPLEPFAELRYTVTKHAVRLTVWRGKARASASVNDIPPRAAEKELLYGDFHWMTMAEIEGLPLGSAQRRLLRLVSDPNDLFGNGSK